MRRLWSLLLAGLLSTGARADITVPLPAGVELRGDGAGGLVLSDGERALLEVQLLLIDGDRVVGLDLAAGARPLPAERARSSARLDGVGLEGLRLEGRARHWGYFHLDDIAFVEFDLRDDSLDAAPAGAPALRARSPVALRSDTWRLRPHLSMGRAPELSATVLWARAEREDGDHLYLALTRLDGRAGRTERFDDGPALIFDGESGAGWPLAFVVARTELSLRHLVGQALLAYGRTPTRPGVWNVPAMCGHCRQPSADELHAKLLPRGEELLLEIEVRAPEHAEAFALEGIRLGKTPLAPWFTGQRGTKATFAFPREERIAERLLAEFRAGALELTLWTRDEIAVTSPAQRLELAEELRSPEAERKALEELLPSTLSPRLLGAWPNPFTESTTIEVAVPATLDEAFDLEPEARARLREEDAPPFGLAPTVSVKVFNLSGQLVQVLEETVRTPGVFTVNWSGTDLSGSPVAAGAYYVHVEMGEWSVTRRVLRLKQ